MKTKSQKKVSTGSMADIAFLLLVFWLMTTSLREEQGILRILPALEENETISEIPDKNVLSVFVNLNDEILVEDQAIEIKELKIIAKEFLCNGGVFKDEQANSEFPERKWLRKDSLIQSINALKQRTNCSNKESIALRNDSLAKLLEKKLAVDYFGEFKILRSDVIISIQNDKTTSYAQYINVQNELTSAINKLRDQLCIQHFGIEFSKLDREKERDKIIAVRQVYPQRISEAEFKN